MSPVSQNTDKNNSKPIWILSVILASVVILVLVFLSVQNKAFGNLFGSQASSTSSEASQNEERKVAPIRDTQSNKQPTNTEPEIVDNKTVDFPKPVKLSGTPTKITETSYIFTFCTVKDDGNCDPNSTTTYKITTTDAALMDRLVKQYVDSSRTNQTITAFPGLIFKDKVTITNP